MFGRESELKSHLSMNLECMQVMGGDWETARMSIKKEKRKRRFDQNREEEREDRRNRYWDNVEKEREERMNRYWENEEKEKEERMNRYWENIDTEREERRNRREQNKEIENDGRRERYRSQLLQRFSQSGRFGPSFPCLVCHELNWLASVEKVESLEQINDNFLCNEYILQHKSLFWKHGTYYCCKRCQRQIDAGVLPTVAARNRFICPWESVAVEFLKLSPVKSYFFMFVL